MRVIDLDVLVVTYSVVMDVVKRVLVEKTRGKVDRRFDS